MQTDAAADHEWPAVDMSQIDLRIICVKMRTKTMSLSQRNEISSIHYKQDWAQY